MLPSPHCVSRCLLISHLPPHWLCCILPQSQGDLSRPDLDHTPSHSDPLNVLRSSAQASPSSSMGYPTPCTIRPCPASSLSAPHSCHTAAVVTQQLLAGIMLSLALVSLIPCLLANHDHTGLPPLRFTPPPSSILVTTSLLTSSPLPGIVSTSGPQLPQGFCCSNTDPCR